MWSMLSRCICTSHQERGPTQTNTCLITAVCSHGPSKQYLSAGEGCFTAQFRTALTRSEHTCMGACVEMGGEGRQQRAEGSALLRRLSADENGSTFLQGFSSACVTSCLGGFSLLLAGSQDYNWSPLQAGLRWIREPWGCEGRRQLYISFFSPSSLVKGMDKLVNLKGYSNL